MLSPSFWLYPSENEVEFHRNTYSNTAALPALDGTNSTFNNFLSPCWDWGSDHIAALRVIDLGAGSFPIVSWAMNASEEFEERGKVLLGILQRPLSEEGHFLSSLWDQDENTVVSNDLGDSVALGRGVLRHVFPAILASTPTQISKGHHLRYHEDEILLPFPMANVPYRWKARICCGVVVERGHHRSRVPVLACVAEATLGEIVGTMIAVVASNLSQLKANYTDQECYCINIYHNGTRIIIYAALFTTEYITAVRCHPVLPKSAQLFVRHTREFDLHIPEDRMEMAEHLRGLAFYMTSGKTCIGRLQRIFRDNDSYNDGYFHFSSQTTETNES